MRRPEWLRRVEEHLRPVDFWSPPKALGIGVGSGLAVGLGIAATRAAWAASAGVVLVGTATWLAFSGKPIAVLRERPKVKPPEPPPPPGPRKEPPRGLPSDALGMVWLDGGTFLMGSAADDPLAYDDERPQHSVVVEPFAIASLLVRESLYRDVIRASPYAALMDASPGHWERDDVPVTNVTWFDAVRFCNALSMLEGLRPAYRIGEGKRSNVEWDSDVDGYRLPTEAEWEYAARAGTTMAWSFGEDDALIGKYTWYVNNSGSRPHPVGEKRPNPWGLYDMHGNVWEWCWNDYNQYHSTDTKMSPSVLLVLRGGSCGHDPRDLRSARRLWNLPGGGSWYVGFRCVRGPARQH